MAGFGRGATLGALWVATEWARHRSYGGYPERWRDDPEGADVAGCVWMVLDPKLEGGSAPVLDWLKRAEAKRSVVLAWAYDGADRAAARQVERCAADFNRGAEKVSLSRKVGRAGARPVTVGPGGPTWSARPSPPSATAVRPPPGRTGISPTAGTCECPPPGVSRWPRRRARTRCSRCRPPA